MNEFITSMLVLAAEFGAIIIALFLIVMTLLYFRRRKEAGMANIFTKRYRETTMNRKENLGKEISEIYSLDGDVGEDYAIKILKNERNIFANVLRIFRGDDKSVILNFQDDLSNLSGTYHELASISNKHATINEAADAEPNENNLDDMTSELNVLREENKRLKEDLKKSLENVDYLQTQYTELFDKTKQNIN